MMPGQIRVPFEKHADKRETAIVGILALAAAIAAGTVFTLWPSIDISISSYFLQPDGSFVLAVSPFWQGVRAVCLRIFTVWYITIAVAGLLAYRLNLPAMRIEWQRWLYLAICSIVGPLLLVNVFLKEHWGRWRPREILELGGHEIFTPVLQAGGSCARNCSFVSGEVASVVMLFAGLGFASRHWRPIHFGLALVFGGLVAFIRVGQGGHFVSDALIGGLAMVLIAAVLHYGMFLNNHSPLRRQV